MVVGIVVLGIAYVCEEPNDKPAVVESQAVPPGVVPGGEFGFEELPVSPRVRLLVDVN